MQPSPVRATFKCRANSTYSLSPLFTKKVSGQFITSQSRLTNMKYLHNQSIDRSISVSQHCWNLWGREQYFSDSSHPPSTPNIPFDGNAVCFHTNPEQGNAADAECASDLKSFLRETWITGDEWVRAGSLCNLTCVYINSVTVNSPAQKWTLNMHY